MQILARTTAPNKEKLEDDASKPYIKGFNLVTRQVITPANPAPVPVPDSFRELASPAERVMYAISSPYGILASFLGANPLTFLTMLSFGTNPLPSYLIAVGLSLLPGHSVP
jgi:hypothetical protein